MAPRPVAWQGGSLAYYKQIGDVPRTRHTAFRDADGRLRFEELMGEEGFSSDSSLLYHSGVPSAIVDSQVWELPDLSTTPNHPLRPRHLRLHDLPGAPDDDAVEHRRLVLGNGDVRISYVLATAASPLYRNALGDECVYVESGSGTVETVFGELGYRRGDYVRDPAGHHAPVAPGRGVPALPDRGEQPHRTPEALPVEVRAAPRARAVLRARPARAGWASPRATAPTSRCCSSIAVTVRAASSGRG